MDFSTYQKLVFSQARANGNGRLQGAALDARLKKLGKSRLCFKADCQSYRRRLGAVHDAAEAETLRLEEQALVARHNEHSRAFHAMHQGDGRCWCFQDPDADDLRRTRSRRVGLEQQAARALGDTNDPALTAEVDALQRQRSALKLQLSEFDGMIDLRKPIEAATAEVERARSLLEALLDGKVSLRRDRPGAAPEYGRQYDVMTDDRDPRDILRERRHALVMAEKQLSVLVDRQTALRGTRGGIADLDLAIEAAQHELLRAESMAWFSGDE